MGLSTTHLIIFLVIVVLIFGTKKLKNMGSDLGGAVKGFKDGVKDGTATDKTASDPAATVQQVAAPVVTPVTRDAVDVESRPKG